MDLDTESNPFHIPNDEEIFVLRDQERRKRLLDSYNNSKLPVYSKPTWSSKINIKKFDTFYKKKQRSLKSRPKSNKLIRESPKTEETKKKENMKEFIEKKRKMFLLQMSLDSKKFEIQKLQKLAASRKKKLKHCEDSLIKDSHRFEDFLTENDITAINCINAAEDAKKKKISKKKELLGLKQQVKLVELEIQKVDEQLDDCKTYKSFLDKLTPPNWLKGNNAEDEMYFKSPEQLLDIFSELEQNNLALMKRANDIEKQLEDTKKTFRETKRKMKKKQSAFTSKITQYEKDIKKEFEKADEMKEKRDKEKEETNPMNELKEEIKQIYLSIGLTLPSNNSDIEHLQMLSKIETEIEKCISKIEKFNIPSWVAKNIKKLEKDRRQEQRQKNKRILQRKKVHLDAGKVYHDSVVEYKIPVRPLMYRSIPVDIKKKKKKKEISEKKDGFLELFGV